MADTARLSQIRCILFDIGNTIWTYRADHAQQIEMRNLQHALALLTQFYPSLHSILSLDLVREIDNSFFEAAQQAREEQIENEPVIVDIMRSTLLALELPDLSNEQYIALAESFRVRSSDGRKLFPEAHTVLSTLREHGYTLGVVTNRLYGGELFYEDLAYFDLLQYFDYEAMSISADLGIRKPGSAIFQRALDRLGFQAGETAMVGDDLVCDAWGAQKLGVFTIWKLSPWLWAELAVPRPELNEPTVAASLVEKWRVRLADPVLPVTYRPDLIIQHLDELLSSFSALG